MSDRKAKFRDHLDKFAADHFGSTISKLNDKQRSDALTLCYLLDIRSALLPGAIPEDLEELQEYICDGKDDRMIDFLYRDDNNHVTIIQSKHRASGKDKSEPDFDAFRACLKKLCPQTRPSGQRLNQRLLDLASEIEWDTDQFTLIFLSLARNSTNIERLAQQDLDDIANSPLKDISTRSDLLYLSEDEINKLWRDVVSQHTGVMPVVEILLSSTGQERPDLFELESKGGVRSFLAQLSARQIHQLYNRHRDKLFNLNIRNYIGDTRTNKEIIKSAQFDPDNFYFFNNGISAVAGKVEVHVDGGQTTLRCSDFSIINGAQTFRSISKAHTRSADRATDNLRVLLRVSEIDFRQQQGAIVLDLMSRFNNTQNAMKLSDFRSNDDVQLSIVRYVNDVAAYRGRKYLYRNKRTQGADRNRITIKMDDFCRAVYAFQFGPIDFFKGQSHLYDTGPEGGYIKLFGQDLEPLSQAEFDRLFGIWLTTSHVADQLREDKEGLASSEDDVDQIRLRALERKYLTFFAFGEVLREICRLRKIDENAFLRSFSKPRWQNDGDKVEFVKESFAIACDMVVQAYQMARSGGQPFVHRNFFREAATLVSVRDARAARRGQLTKLSEMIADKSAITA